MYPNKRKRNKNIILFLLCFSILFCSGCQKSPDSNNQPQTTANAIDNNTQTDNKSFEEFAKELFCNTITSNAIYLHAFLEHPENYGITDYDITFGEIDLENLDDMSNISDSLSQLLCYDRNSLTDAQKITYDHLKWYLETELEYSDLTLLGNAFSPRIGINVQLPITLAQYAFKEEKDVEEYLKLLEDTDRYFSDLIAYEKLKSEKGFFMESSNAEKIIEQCQTFVNDCNDGFLITSFKERLDSLNMDDTEKINAYVERNAKAVNEHVKKAYQIVIDGFTEIKNTGKCSGGLCNYPNGEKYYEYLLESNMGWKKTVEEYDNLLDQYIAHFTNEVAAILSKDMTLAYQLDTLSFGSKTPQEMLTDLKNKIANDFPEPAKVDYQIKYIAESLQPYASPAMYFLPQIDDINDNSIYINPGTDDASDLYTTMAHEGYPGHLYQTTYFLNTNPDLIRYLISPGGYDEGWGTYCEAQSYLYAETDNMNLKILAQANFSLTMLVYGKVDIGVNQYAWTVDDVFNYIKSFGYTKYSVAENMYESMVTEPGNYAKYILGYVGFLELKGEAKKLLKDSFNLKEFHKYILDMGAVPFKMLFDNLSSLAVQTTASAE